MLGAEGRSVERPAAPHDFGFEGAILADEDIDLEPEGRMDDVERGCLMLRLHCAEVEAASVRTQRPPAPLAGEGLDQELGLRGVGGDSVARTGAAPPQSVLDSQPLEHPDHLADDPIDSGRAHRVVSAAGIAGWPRSGCRVSRALDRPLAGGVQSGRGHSALFTDMRRCSRLPWLSRPAPLIRSDQRVGRVARGLR